jgi:plasmid stabilization system protein ParE
MGAVKVSARALARLRSIHAHIAPHGPDAAANVIGEIERVGSLIATQPRMGRAIPGTSLRFHITRRYGYRVIYRVTADGIELRDVLHPRQNWPQGR